MKNEGGARGCGIVAILITLPVLVVMSLVSIVSEHYRPEDGEERE